MNRINAPISFQGGKQRIAKQIVDIISARADTYKKSFFDVCCGSGAVSIEIFNRSLDFSSITMVDASVWGDFWKSIGDGSFSIDLFRLYLNQVPKEKENIKTYLDTLSRESPFDGVNLSHVYRYLILQAGSFGGKHIWIEGGKWRNNSFRSYWKPTEYSNRKSPVNPMMPMPDTLLKRVELISSEMFMAINGINKNANSLTEFPENSVIYIDPPYKGTTKYGYDIDVFAWAENVKQKNRNVKIFISEAHKVDGKFSWVVSQKRSKGNISGNNYAGVSEWLIEW